MKQYLRFILIAIDQLANTLLGGFADETLSSRIYRHANVAQPKKRWRWALMMVNGLFFWQENHCKGAFEMERNRKHFPESLR